MKIKLAVNKIIGR